MKRPDGITLLAILYLLGSLLILGMQIFMWDQLVLAVTTLSVTGIYAVLMVNLIAGLGFAAGVGMWKGKKWGWWAGAFLLILSVARAIDSLLAIPATTKQFGPPETGVALYYIKFGGRAILYSFLIRYLFTDGVETYFGVASIPGRKRFIYLAGVTMLIMAVIAVVSWVWGGVSK